MKENKEGRKQEEEMRVDSWKSRFFQTMTADHKDDTEISDQMNVDNHPHNCAKGSTW